jgi:hypothetical protein
MINFIKTGLITFIFLTITIISANANEIDLGLIFGEGPKTTRHFLVRETQLTDSSEITEQDVKLMFEKVNLGVDLISRFWKEKFAQNGFIYQAPQIKYYTAPVETGCGKAVMNNAFYCPKDHTVYFDAVFFTRLMKAVGAKFGTDGDMAIIFVLAHEWGHVTQRLTGTLTGVTILNENNADCTAGAFTLYSNQQGWLEKGDMDELTLALSAFGDDLPLHDSHGTSEERLLMFKRGVTRGLMACGVFTK